jgi:hemerythrin-like domain-containing protein
MGLLPEPEVIMFEDNSDIIRMLSTDHQALRSLMAAMEHAGDVMEKKAIFSEFLPLLESHTYAQEETLMSRSLSDQNLRPFAMECIEEHDVTEFLAAKLKRSASDDQWLARAGVLCNFLEVHLDNEEREFFPAVEKSLTFAVRAELGERYAEAREKLKLAPIIELPIRTSSLQSQSGRLGFALAWLLGVPPGFC